MQLMVLLKKVDLGRWIKRALVIKWHRFGLVVAIITLSACGGNGNNSSSENSNFVSVQPVSLLFRSGEIEQARLIASNVGLLSSGVSDIYGAKSITANGQQSCLQSDLICEVINITGNVDASIYGLELLEFIPRTFGSNIIGQSTLPLIGFDENVTTSVPITRFATSTTERIEDPLGDSIFFDDDIGHSLAVAADGSIWAWGQNTRGQLGDNTTISRAMPVQVQSAMVFTDVAGGSEHSLALASNGTVWNWGANSGSFSDDNNIEIEPTPSLVQGLNDVVAIAAGGSNSIVLLADGSVWTWNEGASGNLPKQVDLPEIATAITAGADHALALLSDGKVAAWGNNDYGQLSTKLDLVSIDNPVIVTNIPQTVVGVAAGPGFSAVVLADETVWTWGLNNTNQLGYLASDECRGLAFENICSRTPLPVSGLDNVTNIATGGRFVLARRNDGSVWAWGDNSYGQLGGLPGGAILTPQPILGLSNVLNISAGHRSALAMSADQSCSVGDGRFGGRLMAWGNNLFGTRGDGTAVNWFRPTPVLTLGDSPQCAGVIGNRLIVYKSGTGTGTVESDQPGFTCTGNICWQALEPDAVVTLTAIPDTNSTFSDWRWDCPAVTPTSIVMLDKVKHCKVIFSEAVPAPACDDGLDNDGDGLVDLVDPGCESAIDDSEVDSPPPSGDTTLTLTILGGPGAGQVRSNDALMPTMDCINSETAETTCTADFAINTVVELIPEAFGAGGSDVQWTGCDIDIGIEGCTLTMDSNRSVTATFVSISRNSQAQ